VRGWPTTPIPHSGSTGVAPQPHLQPQEVVHRADDNVNGGRVPCLGP
jgi:hypothetical protein